MKGHGYKRLKIYFRKTQRQHRESLRYLEEKEEELQALRIGAETDTSETLVRKLAELEQVVRTRDSLEAEKWRRRSRTRSLKEGEAPSWYFFFQLKAKHQGAAIKTLILDNGETTESEDSVVKEVERFYKDLYQKDESMETADEARNRVLSFISNEVNATQNQELEAELTMEELEDIVKRLLEEKAPGLDGAPPPWPGSAGPS
ncbi:hypothetical protein R1sor_017061 [Riccia sorocarpa]|uniref:Uncharacterized protein n=1 Tax=Riccia sorocarpa TaxID=122646 RepID=A0ABD3I7K7_9MARC